MKKAAIILALSLSVCLLTACGDPVDKMMKAVEDGDYAKASEVYENEIIGNTALEDAATALITNEADAIYSQYNTGELNYEEAIQKIETIEAINAEGWSYIYSQKQMLADLHASKSCYSEGQKHLDEGNYSDAILKFFGVSMDDALFDTVPEKLRNSFDNLNRMMEEWTTTGNWGNAMKGYADMSVWYDRTLPEIYIAYMDSYSEEYTEKYVTSLENAGATEALVSFEHQLYSLEQAINDNFGPWFSAQLESRYGETGDIPAVLSFIREYYDFFVEGDKNNPFSMDFDEFWSFVMFHGQALFEQKAMDYAEKARGVLEETGNYSKTVSILEQGRDDFLSACEDAFSVADTSLIMAFWNPLDETEKELEQLYTVSVTKNASDLFNAGEGSNYEAAIKVIREGLAELPENDVLTDALDYYLSFAPQPLAGWQPEYAKHVKWTDTPDAELNDLSGNAYKTVHYPYDCYEPWGFLYYLNAEYKALTGYVYWPTTARVQDGNVLCKIYGDGELLYESPVLTKKSVEPVPLNVDVTGVRELTISFSGSDGVYHYANDCGPKICLGDLTVQKVLSAPNTVNESPADHSQEPFEPNGNATREMASPPATPELEPEDENNSWPPLPLASTVIVAPSDQAIWFNGAQTRIITAEKGAYQFAAPDDYSERFSTVKKGTVVEMIAQEGAFGLCVKEGQILGWIRTKNLGVG